MINAACHPTILNNIIEMVNEDSMIVNILIGLFTGVIAALAAGIPLSIFFYRLAKEDSNILYHRNQLDSVLLRLKQLCPTRSRSIRGQDGAEDTMHWLQCMSELMSESGFPKSSKVILEIVVQIEEIPKYLDETPSKAKDEADLKKKIWYARIRELHGEQKLSFLSRISGRPIPPD